jgi:hypothetical protein
MSTIKSLFSVLCSLAMFASGLCYSQDTLIIFTYPSEKEIDVAIEATSMFAEGKYKYSYNVNSSLSSEQVVSDFDVVHLSPVDSIRNPNGWWGSIAPATIVRVSWSGSDTVYMVPPGGTLAGFSFSSVGLPAVGDFYATGWIPLPGFTHEEWPDSIIGGVFPENSFHGRTLVPRTPPTPFTALTFLDTIKSYITESRTLGWIGTQATADKYTAFINSAQSHLASSPPQRGVAKAKLDSVLTNVYPDSGAGTITSEAYALLRFNTEYVLKKLREEDEERRVIEGKEK